MRERYSVSNDMVPGLWDVCDGPGVQIATFINESAAHAYAAILNVCVEADIDTADGLAAFNRRISARINEFADEMEARNG